MRYTHYRVWVADTYYDVYASCTTVAAILACAKAINDAKDRIIFKIVNMETGAIADYTNAPSGGAFLML